MPTFDWCLTDTMITYTIRAECWTCLFNLISSTLRTTLVFYCCRIFFLFCLFHDVCEIAQRDKVISTIWRCKTVRVVTVLFFGRLTLDSLWEYSGQKIHVELQDPLGHTAGLGSWAGVIMEYALLCLTATGFFVQTFCFSGKEYRTWSSLHERQLFRGVVIYQIAVGSLLNHSPTLVLPTPLLCDVIPS